MSAPKITFIDAGSTAFVKNILGDVFHRETLKAAYIALMDIDPTHLEESHIVVRKLMNSAGASGETTCYTQQKEALQDTDFMVVALQIGGYEPYTVTDFEVCERYGLEQTIANTLGPSGIMRTLRTIPHLWRIYENMTEVYPDTTILSYVNPVTMNTWAMYARCPHIKQVGLYHSVQGTAEELACDLNIDPATPRYRCASVNRTAFYPELERRTADGSYANLYPELLAVYEARQVPKPNIHGNTRCQNIVRYKMFKKPSYLVTESSERFTEYTPWSIKPGREDLIERYKVPPDEYPKRRVERLANQHKELKECKNVSRIDIKPSREYASTITNAIWTGEPSMTHGNVHNDGLTDNLPQGYCVEVACLADANGIRPAKVGALSSHLTALMQTNINIQTLLTEAILTENHDHVYHAAMMDPYTAAVLGIDGIYTHVDNLIAAHGDQLPGWLHR